VVQTGGGRALSDPYASPDQARLQKELDRKRLVAQVLVEEVRRPPVALRALQMCRRMPRLTEKSELKILRSVRDGG
jgi:hypothetical protein